MGITDFTAYKLQQIIDKKNPGSVIELGSQNLYTQGSDTVKPPFANKWYEDRGIVSYRCIDLAGDNNSLRWDLSVERDFPIAADLVTDIGTSEHIVQMNSYQTVPFHEGHIHSIYPQGEVGDKRRGYYNAWVAKHKLCNIGGVIYSENPKRDNWPDHGYTYLTKEFYYGLCDLTDYKILGEIEEWAAMGNPKAVNIICSLIKYSEKFPTFEEFSTITVYDK